MSDPGSVEREIGLLEQVQMQMAEISRRADDGRRQDLIDLRRQLAVRIVEVGRIAEPMIVQTGDPLLLKTYREKISRMRFAAAMHQADWPAVTLGDRPEEFLVSAAAVREANREFVAWMRGVLDTMR